MIIFDCDNCISDDEWRIRTIDWDKADPTERYDTYHKLAKYDDARNLHLFPEQEQIAVFTAMPEKFKEERLFWFQKNNLKVDWLLMRRNDDFRPSTEIKRDMLFDLAKKMKTSSFSFVSAAYDDRPDVIQMYKRNGVNGINLAIHDKCAWTKPEKRV